MIYLINNKNIKLLFLLCLVFVVPGFLQMLFPESHNSEHLSITAAVASEMPREVANVVITNYTDVMNNFTISYIWYAGLSRPRVYQINAPDIKLPALSTLQPITIPNNIASPTLAQILTPVRPTNMMNLVSPDNPRYQFG